MKAISPDGRVFETLEFLKIEFDHTEPVYKYKFSTKDRIVTSSARHLWGVWDKKTKKLKMIKMSDIDIERHELLVQELTTTNFI